MQFLSTYNGHKRMWKVTLDWFAEGVRTINLYHYIYTWIFKDYVLYYNRKCETKGKQIMA